MKLVEVFSATEYCTVQHPTHSSPPGSARAGECTLWTFSLVLISINLQRVKLHSLCQVSVFGLTVLQPMLNPNVD